MDYTQSIGNVNELQCLIGFIQLGYECSIPYGNGAKYDFIADINGELLRIQCKSSHYVNDHGKIDNEAFQFSASCQTTNTKKITHYTYDSDQIDYFATYFCGNIYVIPVEECSSSKTLRFSPPRNGSRTYNKAEDYLISNYFRESEHYLRSKESYINRSIEKENTVYTCPICGKEVTHKDSLCVECSRVKSRKTNRPSRDELKEFIRNTSFTEIGRMYNVTDNTVRKWCKSYSLPFRTGDIKKISVRDWQSI